VLGCSFYSFWPHEASGLFGLEVADDPAKLVGRDRAL
jgi:hypothetical protein